MLTAFPHFLKPDQSQLEFLQAWRNWNEGAALNVIDPVLTVGSRSEMMRCIHIGLLCVQENEANRPTMAHIMTVLNSHSITLPVPLKPAFFMHSELRTQAQFSSDYNSRSTESNGSKREDVNQSINEGSISDLYPRQWSRNFNLLSLFLHQHDQFAY